LLKGSGSRLDEIEFEGGRRGACHGILLRPKLQYRTALAGQLGSALAESGAIQIDEAYRTMIAGIYAAGECTGNCGQVAVMAAEGVQAAYKINRDLTEEDLANRAPLPQAALTTLKHSGSPLKREWNWDPT
jgi:thioredoxin reductase